MCTDVPIKGEEGCSYSCAYLPYQRGEGSLSVLMCLSKGRRGLSVLMCPSKGGGGCVYTCAFAFQLSSDHIHVHVHIHVQNVQHIGSYMYMYERLVFGDKKELLIQS